MTTYSFVDESGETRLRGTIDPAPGGAPIERGHYGYAPVTILANDSGDLHFTPHPVNPGDALLDLTDPARPLIITAGTYAMVGRVSLDDNLGTGESFSAQLTADQGTANAASATADAVETAAVPEPSTLLTIVWYLPAAAALVLNVGNNSADPHDYWVSPFFIQRLS